MLKRIVFSLILAVFVLGIVVAFPKKVRELSFLSPPLPTPAKDEPRTTIILTGDIMLGRSVMNESIKNNNPNYPFLLVSDVLKSADLTFSNLENPIIKDCPILTTGMVFCTKPEMIEGLKFAGIDIVSLANNHTENYGKEGLTETKKYLGENRIDFLDGGNLIIKEVNGIKFGFLGFYFMYRKPNELELKLIRESDEKVDILFTMIHWGEEYTSEPNNFQKDIANTLVNNGVDVIVGTHPHWIQSIDIINDKLILYSLGNFVFDQAWSEETKSGLAIRLTYQNDKLINIEKLPVYMKNLGQPEWVNSD